MKNLYNFLIFSLIILGLSLNLSAQRPPRKAQERIELIKKMKLLEILDLSEEKGEKFLLKYKSADDKIRKVDQELMEISEELKKAIDKKENANYSTLTDKLISKQKEFFDAQIDKMTSLKSILSDEEYAKYVLFEENFPKIVRKMLMNHEGRRD